LKFVALPSETFPTQFSKVTGSITGFSIYHAMGLESELDKGKEISMGFDKSILKLFIVAFIFFNRKARKVLRKVRKDF
jgi:hypothetical protein